MMTAIVRLVFCFVVLPAALFAQAPTITVQPQNTSVVSGQNASFSVTATGSGTLTYQWRRNGFPISGATANSHTIFGTKLHDADTYDVVVTANATNTVSNAVRLGVAPASQPGSIKLDQAFDLSVENQNAGQIAAIVPYSATQYIVGGDFVRVAGNSSIRRVARINSADGSLDTSFNVNINGGVSAVVKLPDGDVLVGGGFNVVNGVARGNLVRLNSDGSVDQAFNAGGTGPAAGVLAIVVQSDGKFIIGGNFTAYNGTTTNRIARLNADGSLDTSFATGASAGVNNTVNALALDPVTGKVVAGGLFTDSGRVRIARFNTDGTVDSSFVVGTGFDGNVNALAFDTTSNVLVGGAFTSYNGTANVNRIVRLTSVGAIDSGFVIGTGTTAGTNAAVNSLTYDSANTRWLVGGAFTSYNGSAAFNRHLIRLSAGGVLDGTFADSATTGAVLTIQLQADGAVVFGANTAGAQLARVTGAGAADALLATAFRGTGTVHKVLPLPGGKLLVAGTFSHFGTTPAANLARLNADLSVDVALTTANGPNGAVQAAALQGDGKILIGGFFTSYGGTTANRVARLNPADLSLDGTFSVAGNGPSSGVSAIVPLSGGALYIGGSFNNFNSANPVRPSLVRLTSTGALDASFNAGITTFSVNALALQPDGKLIAGGSFANTTINGSVRNHVVRFNTDGTVDSTFAPAPNGQVRTVALQQDGKVLLGGDFFGGSVTNNIARFSGTDGSADASFLVGTNFNGSVYSILPQEDGKALVMGGFNVPTGAALNVNAYGRLAANGLFDLSTALTGTSIRSFNQPMAFHVLDDGSVLIAFTAATYSNVERLGLLHFVPANAPTIASFTPTSIRPGQALTITGTGFADGVTGIGFSGSNLPVDITSVTNTQITLTVPPYAANGPITVRTFSGNVISAASLAVAPDFQLKNPQLTAASLENIAYGSSTYVLAATSGSIWSSADGISWTKRFFAPNGLNGVSFAAGIFVAVGNGGTLFTSPDGVAWTQRAPIGTSSPLFGVAYDSVGTKWVAVTNTSTVVISSDGVNWSVPVSTNAAQSNGIAFGAGLFVKVGNGGTIRSSPDGITWTTRTSGTANTLNDVVFVNSVFIAGGGSGTLLTSPDGITWTSRTTGSTANLFAATYGVGGAVGPTGKYMIGAGGSPLVSTDLVTWTSVSNAGGNTRGVLYAGGQFVSAGLQGNLFTSPDGVTWTLRASNNQRHWRDITYGNGRFVGVAENATALYSTDGATLNLVTGVAGLTGNLHGVGYGNGLFVGVGPSAIVSTLDGATWSNRTPAGTFTLNSVAYGGGNWIAVGNSGVAYRSTDGFNWSAAPSTGTANNLVYVAYGAGTFVAVGANGTVLTSTNGGDSWTARTSNAGTNVLNGVSYLQGQFIALGTGHALITSPDGTTWTPRALPGTALALTRVTFGDGFYLATANTASNVFFKSSDGATWVQVNPPAEIFNANNGAYVVYGNGSFVTAAGLGFLASSNPATDTMRITTQPVAVTNLSSGQTAALTVTAVGASTYQWYTGYSGDTSAPISLATNSTYDTGVSSRYWVRITQASTGQTIDSSTAEVFAAVPVIAQQPASTTLTVGGGGSLSVNVTGGTPTYQWRKFGQPLAGKTASSLSFTGTTLADAGFYDVVITDGLTQIVSAPARVEVNPATYVSGALRAKGGLAALPRIELAGANVTTFAVDAANDRIYVAGEFSRINGSQRLNLARFKISDGSLDTTYAPEVQLGGGTILALHLQADGKLIVGGDLISLPNGDYRGNLFRLNVNGTLDTSFDPRVNGRVYAVVKQGSKLLVGGTFTTLNNFTVNRLARLHNDGDVNDGTPDGALDPSFVGLTNGDVRAIAIQANGDIVIGGTFTTTNGITTNRLARLRPNGSLDTNFNVVSGLIGTGFNNEIRTLAFQTISGEERILVGGTFSTFNGASTAPDNASGTITLNRLVRLTSAGALDNTFATGTSFNGDVNGLAVQGDNKLVVVGNFTSYKGVTINRIVRLDTAGAADAVGSFDPGVGFNSAVSGVALRGTEILVGGFFTSYKGTGRDGIASIDTAGALTTTLAPTSARRPGQVLAIEPLPDGKWLVAGSFNRVDDAVRNHIARLKADGTFDDTFVPGGTGSGFNGAVNSIAIQADGRVVAGGSFTAFNNNGTNTTRNRILRLNGDGTLDTSFGTTTALVNNTINVVKLQPDGKILAGGAFTDAGRVRIARFLTDGSIDGTFTTVAGFQANVSALSPQLDGTVLVGGGFTSYNGTNINGLVRLSATGSLDTTFNSGGTGLNTGGVNAIVTVFAATPANTKHVIGGGFTTFNGVTRNRLMRLTSTGTADNSFQSNPVFNSTVTSVAVQGDGKIVAAGFSSFSTDDGSFTTLVARLSVDGVNVENLRASSKLSGLAYEPRIRFAPDGTLAVGAGRVDFVEAIGSGSFFLLEPAPVPVITQQPVSVATTLGSPASFTVVATGENLSYQWFRGSDLVVGATSTTYTISSTSLNDLGEDIYVRISNPWGQVYSDDEITVSGSNPPAVITTQPPASVVATAGQPASITFAATATTPAYVWLKYGDIGVPEHAFGSSNATLNFSNVGLHHAGYYQAFALDGLSYVAAQPVRLSVFPATNPTGVRVRDSFAGNVETTGNITAFASLPDGRFYAAGTFTSVDGVTRQGIARFAATGEFDASWVPVAINGAITSLALQSDGKILIGGNFLFVGGRNTFRIARLLATGAVDTSFEVGSGLSGGAPNAIVATGTSPNIKIYLGGVFSDLNNTPASRIIKLNENGSPDNTFVSGAGFDNTVTSLVLDGSNLMVGGAFLSYNGQLAPRLARLDATTGAFDATFGAAIGAGFDNTISALALKGSQLVAVGPFTSYNGVSSVGMALLNSNGTRVAGFPTGAGFANGTNALAVNTVAVQGDGKILVGGAFTTYGGASAVRLVRLDGTTGALDTVFNARLGTNANNNVNAIAVQADGKILLGGVFNGVNSVPHVALARLDAAGNLDSGVSAALRAPGTINTVTPVAGGKFMIGGTFSHVNGIPVGNIARILPDGTVDTSFLSGSGFNNTVRTIVDQGDGFLAVGGSFTLYNGVAAGRIARLSPEGTIDLFFVGAGFGNGTVISLAQTADDELIAVGTFTSLNGVPVNRVARLSNGGDIDEDFNAAVSTGTGVNNTVNVVLAMPDGSIVIGGSFSTYNNAPAAPLLRFDRDGVLDTSFSSSSNFNGVGSSNPSVNALLLQPDGRILVAGSFDGFRSTAHSGLVRILPSGAIDNTFSTGLGFRTSTGAGTVITALALQGDGRIIAAGANASLVNNQRISAVARLNADGSFDSTFGIPFTLPTASSAINTLTLMVDGSLLMGTTRADFVDRTTSGLTLFESAPLPLILQSPFASGFQAGSSGALTVNAVGVGPLRYEWKRNGITVNNAIGDIIGAATNTLVFADFQAANVGNYTVTVTDSTNASITSAPQAISLLATPPTIINQTYVVRGQVIQRGTVASARVDAIGSAPIAAQWQKNSANIAGGASSYGDFELFRSPWTPADAGSYRVILSNSVNGSSQVESAAARIWVNEEPGWSVHRPLPIANAVSALEVVDGKFFMGGLQGVRLTSTDGLNWTTLPSLSSNAVLGYAVGNGRRVQLGTNGFIAVSTDGLDWQTGAILPMEPTQGIAFGHGVFVVASGSVGSPTRTARIVTSPDGVTWTERFNSTVGAFGHVAHGNGVTLVNVAEGKLVRSVDGIAWTLVDSPSRNATAVKFVNGQFFVLGDRGELFVSADGAAWTARTTGTGNALNNVAFGNGLYLAVGSGGTIITSPDTTTWTVQASGTADPLRPVAYAAGLWVVANDEATLTKIRTSPDGITWTRTSNVANPQTFQSIATNGTSLVVVSDQGEIMRSTDGATWTDIPSGTSNRLLGITATPSGYLAVGGNDGVATILNSTDGGLTFAAVTSPVANLLRTVERLNGTYFAFGDEGTLLTSTNATTWTSVPLSSTLSISGVAFNAGSYVAVGSGGAILTSSNGTTWTPANSGTTAALNKVAYGNGVWVAVGASGTILTSADLATWTSRGFNVVDNFAACIFDGTRFFISGGNNSVYSSVNGIDWDGRHLASEAKLADVVPFNGRLYGVAASSKILSAPLVPAIFQAPASQLFAIGQPVTLRVGVEGAALGVSYQWYKGATAISGATSSTLQINSAQVGDLGAYTVVVSTGAGNVTSAVANLTTDAGAIASVTPGSTAANATVTIAGAGFTGATAVKFNGLDAASFTVVSATEITAVVPTFATSGLVTVFTPSGTLTSPASLTVTQGSRLPAISQMGGVGATAEQALLVNFTIEGTGTKQVLIRGAGPSLATFSIPNALADPRLELFGGNGVLINSNDDWGGQSAISNANVAVGAFAFASPTSKDAALLVTLAPGTYTARVTGVGGTTGTAMAEVYETDAGALRLGGVAARGQATPTSPNLAGFVITGATPKTVLVRGVGSPLVPALGAMANPTLGVYNTSPTAIATNADWQTNTNLDALAAATAAAGAMPLGTADAALLLTLPPGSYTAQVRGENGSSGYVLAEVFIIDGYRAESFAPALLAPMENVIKPAGSSVYFNAPTVAKPGPVTYVWRRNGTVVTSAGGVGPQTLFILSATEADSGLYEVTMTNGIGATTTASAFLTVGPAAGVGATHGVTNAGRGYLPGANVTITNTLYYSGTAQSLGWSVVLPAGWAYVSDTLGSSGVVKPAVGSTGTLDWAWTTVPASPVTFTYTVSVPAGELGARAITANAIVRPTGAPAPLQFAPAPATLSLRGPHSADTSGAADTFRINLLELTRVIELFNTRNGTQRTGAYKVATTATEDGFEPDPARAPNQPTTLSRYHSADSNQNGSLSLLELTRVIELFNYRSGTQRTGQYHVAPANLEDGYEPGP